MQDRFLFRVWDKERKTYDCSPYGENALGASDCSEVNEEYFAVEQCTGLHDKNGDLIYEGDIVFINGELRRKLDNAIEALRFYADADVYEYYDKYESTAVQHDGGQKARETLKEIEK